MSTVVRERRCATSSCVPWNECTESGACPSYEMHTAIWWHCTTCRLPSRPIRGGTGLCALYNNPSEFKKVVFAVAALLRTDDGLLEQYMTHQFFPVSYLRRCSLEFVQSDDDVVRSLFRQAQAFKRPLKLDEFNKLRMYSSSSSGSSNRRRTRSSIVDDDPFRVLQLPRDTTRIDVHKAYRRLMRQHLRDIDELHAQLAAKKARIEAATEAAERAVEGRIAVQTSHNMQTANNNSNSNSNNSNNNNNNNNNNSDNNDNNDNNNNRARTSSSVVRCQSCKRDCTSDGRETKMCCTSTCLNECHADCVPSDQRGTWQCQQCAGSNVEEQKEQD